jgi:hypothetical protein
MFARILTASFISLAAVSGAAMADSRGDFLCLADRAYQTEPSRCIDAGSAKQTSTVGLAAPQAEGVAKKGRVFEFIGESEDERFERTDD